MRQRQPEKPQSGRLTLIHRLPYRTRDGHVQARFRCACGNIIVTAISRVKHGQTKSCGCLARERTSARATRHGMKGTPEYSSWQAMRSRCTNPRTKDFARYGAVGIGVCEEWRLSFESFYAHIGPRPPGTSLDRIDGSKGYEPGNVRWATLIEQARNRRDFTIISTPLGTMPLVDYAQRIGLTRGAAHLRLKRGKLEGCARV